MNNERTDGKPPILTRERIAELSELAKKVDREEADEIKALGRKVFAWRDAGRFADVANIKESKEEGI